MLRESFIVFILAVSLAACQKSADSAGNVAKAADNPAQDAPILIAAEDLLTVHNGSLAAGTVITGSIQPERRADLRAEVSAVVLQVLKENGETVRRGELLMRLDDTAIRDALTSSEAAARAASQALDQAESSSSACKPCAARAWRRRSSWKMRKFAAITRKATRPAPKAAWCRRSTIATHGNSRAVRWRSQRTQGIDRRHRRHRQGVDQGDRPRQRAL